MDVADAFRRYSSTPRYPSPSQSFILVTCRPLEKESDSPAPKTERVFFSAQRQFLNNQPRLNIVHDTATRFQKPAFNTHDLLTVELSETHLYTLDYRTTRRLQSWESGVSWADTVFVGSNRTCALLLRLGVSEYPRASWAGKWKTCRQGR